ncbi:MAG: hypothetical protein DWH80_04020 [Planctomycetota bacterium]|nr:MAG: hypothetical protein DWH80_04020 [Planctomycetota bacterium]
MNSTETSSPLTDSLWFWIACFATMALVGLFVIGPKFDRRQRQIENRFLGREHLAAQRTQLLKESPFNPQHEATANDPVIIQSDQSHHTPPIVPLWPLASLSLVLILISSLMLFRERQRLSVLVAADKIRSHAHSGTLKDVSAESVDVG